MPGLERTSRLHCVTRPVDVQKLLFIRLGLTSPQCLRTINEVKQM